MEKIDLINGLLARGFAQSLRNRNILVISSHTDFSPSFLIRVRSSRGNLRYDGAFGLNSELFEQEWRKNLSPFERKADNVTALVSHIDNFGDCLDSVVFRDIRSTNDIDQACDSIYATLCNGPKTEDALYASIKRDNLFGIGINKFINIAMYYSEQDIRQRKSVQFIKWLIRRNRRFEDIFRVTLVNEQWEIFQKYDSAIMKAFY